MTLGSEGRGGEPVVPIRRDLAYVRSAPRKDEDRICRANHAHDRTYGSVPLKRGVVTGPLHSFSYLFVAGRSALGPHLRHFDRGYPDHGARRLAAWATVDGPDLRWPDESGASAGSPVAVGSMRLVGPEVLLWSAQAKTVAS
jgi:hypothetical protein